MEPAFQRCTVRTLRSRFLTIWTSLTIKVREVLVIQQKDADPGKGEEI